MALEDYTETSDDSSTFLSVAQSVSSWGDKTSKERFTQKILISVASGRLGGSKTSYIKLNKNALPLENVVYENTGLYSKYI